MQFVFFVDHSEQNAKIILTGSSVPADKSKIVHTGTGRFTKLKMRTMSLFESGDSNGEVFIHKLFKKECSIVSGKSSIDFDEINYLICRGGWPESLIYSKKHALSLSYDYYENVINDDIFRTDVSLAN